MFAVGLLKLMQNLKKSTSASCSIKAYGYRGHKKIVRLQQIVSHSIILEVSPKQNYA